MTDLLPSIDPRHTALLVMDYQVQILNSLSDAEVLLSRTADAIAIVRRHGGQIGHVRVAFEDADYAAIPNTNKMAARVAASGGNLDSEAPASAIHEDVAPHADLSAVRDAADRDYRVFVLAAACPDPRPPTRRARLPHRAHLPPAGGRDHHDRAQGSAGPG